MLSSDNIFKQTTYYGSSYAVILLTGPANNIWLDNAHNRFTKTQTTTCVTQAYDILLQRLTAVTGSQVTGYYDSNYYQLCTVKLL